jgi:23S rRNA (guanosine2251-2'-O)-methyltransferase
LSSYIYGKYPVQEFLKLHRKLAKKLWYVSENHLRLLPDLDRDLPREEIRAPELAREFGLREYESHQGLLLETEKDLRSLLYMRLEDLLIEASEQSKSLIWLPEIQDGHNLGAITRSCVAFEGIAGIVLPEKNSARLNPAVAKVSAGTVFAMKYAGFHNIKATAQLIQSAGFKLIAIEKRPASILLNEFDFKQNTPAVIILGSEGEGIPSQIALFCDYSIQIPQSEAVDSLNLSVSAGIFLYEMRKSLG